MPADATTNESESQGWSAPPESLVPLSHPLLAILPALVASTVVYAAYLLTHSYPALGGGLFLAMVEAVAENGYALPTHVAGYTPGGIPFAYPPLAFYLLAPLLDAGLAPLALARFLPGLLTIFAVVPTYFLGRRLLDSNARAGFASLLVATSPAVFTWHLSAGGVVRAPAFLLTICGLYTGYRLFNSERQWALPTAILFGLTVLTHPLYPVLFGSGVLYFYLARDRSRRGFALGALVAFGGLTLAAPWWLTVLSRHGVGVFTQTAGSRLGIGQGIIWFPTNFAYLPETRFLALWHVLVLLGAICSLVRRRYFLVGWFAITALVYPEPRFLLFIGAFLASSFIFDNFLPILTDVDTCNDADADVDDGDDHDHYRRVAARNRSSLSSENRSLGVGIIARFVLLLGRDRTRDRNPGRRDRVVTLAVLSVFVLYGVTTGALYAANYEPIPERSSDRLLVDPLPVYVDDEDVRAMAWVRRNTPPGAAFLIAGDVAEWFPLLAERTSVTSPWGAEWLPPQRRDRQIERYRTAAECYTERCLTRELDRTAASPAYLYVPREGSQSWTVRDDLSRDQWVELASAFKQSSQYEVVYWNWDVLIVRSLDRPQAMTRKPGLQHSWVRNSTPKRRSSLK